MSHFIDHGTLKKAAAELAIIADGGYSDQLRREFLERRADDPRTKVRTTWHDPLVEWQLDDRAKLLSLLTSAPVGQCKSVIRELDGSLPEREMGLCLLSEMAGEVVRLRTRQRTEGRRAS